MRNPLCTLNAVFTGYIVASLQSCAAYFTALLTVGWHVVWEER